MYRGLVASILAALKAACEHEGLPPPQNEAASLSEWVESTENSLRLEYREMLRRHSFIDANSNRFRDERGLAELQRLSLAQLHSIATLLVALQQSQHKVLPLLLLKLILLLLLKLRLLWLKLRHKLLA